MFSSLNLVFSTIPSRKRCLYSRRSHHRQIIFGGRNMLILLYLAIRNILIPDIMAIAGASLEPVMIICIMAAGILLVFGSVGVHISNNLGSTVIGGILRGIGWLVQQIFRGIAWIFRQIATIIPRFYRWLVSSGVSAPLAVILSIILLLIII